MSFASDLKQKSKSANSERLMKIKAERNRAIAVEKKINEKRLLENAAKIKQQADQKKLIKLISPGLLAAWNGDEVLKYLPQTNDEIEIAKKLLGYRAVIPDLSALQVALGTLEIDLKVFENRLNRLSDYTKKTAPKLPFVINDCISLFVNKRYIFDSKWKATFKEKIFDFEKSAIEMSRVEHKRKVQEFKCLRIEIEEDSDLRQISDLAADLKPRILEFHRKYHELMSSPSSVFKVSSSSKDFEAIEFTELITRREYQLAVARFVLRDMGVVYYITAPDVTGKFMTAFRVASGEVLFDTLLEHITDSELIDKFIRYKKYSDSYVSKDSDTVLHEGQDIKVIALLNQVYSNVLKIEKILKRIDLSIVEIINGELIHAPSLKIANLEIINKFPQYSKLVTDIKWLSSPVGQRFKKGLSSYLQLIAEQGKYIAKVKIFEIEGCLLIELPDRKDLKCHMDWRNFEVLLELLGLEIAEATSTGAVKLKWE